MENDILFDLFKLYPYSENKLKEIAIGQKNVAVMLSDGTIGVCSTLGNSIESSPYEILLNPNFQNPRHRILINAWVNAHCNYDTSISGISDIIEAVNFNQYESIVMVGYFGSLASKLEKKNIKITIFDLDEEDKPVEPMRFQKKSLNESDCVILTATSLFNLSYFDIISNVNENSHIFILGPSTPLSHLFFKQSNIKGLFGARFLPFDLDVMNSIANGGGTRSFLQRMDKVYIISNSDLE